MMIYVYGIYIFYLYYQLLRRLHLIYIIFIAYSLAIAYKLSCKGYKYLNTILYFRFMLYYNLIKLL